MWEFAVFSPGATMVLCYHKVLLLPSSSSLAWGNLSLFSIVVVVVVVFPFFGWGGVLGWSLFHRKHIEDGIITPLCLAACHFESVFFGRCLLPFCTTAWISRIEQQPHNLCCRTWNSKLGNKSESLSLPCFLNLSVSQQMASCCKTLVQQRELKRCLIS